MRALLLVEHYDGRPGVMTKSRNRMVAIWAGVEARERVWRLIALVAATGLILSLMSNYRQLAKEREVVRIGCDGIPNLVRLDPQAEAVYAEPAEHELRAFGALIGTALMRRDSFSVRQDFAFASSYMLPELYEQFQADAQGTAERPGAVSQIESLQQRTNVPEESLEVAVDKRPYPWIVRVKGVRKVVGQEREQPFVVELQLLRASRKRTLGGLVISKIVAPGTPLSDPQVVRPREEE